MYDVLTYSRGNVYVKPNIFLGRDMELRSRSYNIAVAGLGGWRWQHACLNQLTVYH